MTNVYEGYSAEDLNSSYFIHGSGYRSVPGFPHIHVLVDGTGVWNAKTKRPLSIWYNHAGYPKVTFDGRHWRVQRLVLAAWRPGCLDDGSMALHRNPTRSFVAYWNLRPGTAKENTADMIRDGNYRNANGEKTHCIRGHSLTGANLVASALGQGKRTCRACNNTARKVRNFTKRYGSAPSDSQVQAWHEEYYGRYIAETLALIDYAAHNPQTAMALSA